jgi:hypothetical protein
MDDSGRGEQKDRIRERERGMTMPDGVIISHPQHHTRDDLIILTGYMYCTVLYRIHYYFLSAPD